MGRNLFADKQPRKGRNLFASEPELTQSSPSFSILGQNLPQDEEAQKEYNKGMMRQGAQGLTFGSADELEAAVRSMSSETTYEQERDQIRSANKEFAKENPGAAIGAQVVGGLTTGGTSVARTVLANGGGRILAGATQGAAFGAAGGAGASEAELVGDDKEIGKFVGDTGRGLLIGAAAGGTLGAIGKYVANKNIQNQELRRILESGNPDSRAAKYALDGSNKLVKVKEAQEAIKQGFDEGVVDMIKGASKADRVNMQKMVNSMIQGRRNPLKALRDRPANVLGQSTSKRYAYV
jgi:hypothetical protein